MGAPERRLKRPYRDPAEPPKDALGRPMKKIDSGEALLCTPAKSTWGSTIVVSTDCEALADCLDDLGNDPVALGVCPPDNGVGLDRWQGSAYMDEDGKTYFFGEVGGVTVETLGDMLDLDYEANDE